MVRLAEMPLLFDPDSAWAYGLEIAPAVDGVLVDVLDRLKRFVEISQD